VTQVVIHFLKVVQVDEENGCCAIEAAGQSRRQCPTKMSAIPQPREHVLQRAIEEIRLVLALRSDVLKYGNPALPANTPDVHVDGQRAVDPEKAYRGVVRLRGIYRLSEPRDQQSL